MDINQIAFIAVICFLGYVILLNPFVSQTKTARYKRYFRKAKNTRAAIIKKYSNHPENIPDDVTPQEIVAILALIAAHEDASKAYSVAMQFANSNLEDKFDEEFFNFLFATGKRFSSVRWFKESMEMLNLGRRLSKQLGKDHWLAEFKDAIEYVNRMKTTGHSSN